MEKLFGQVRLERYLRGVLRGAGVVVKQIGDQMGDGFDAANKSREFGAPRYEHKKIGETAVAPNSVVDDIDVALSTQSLDIGEGIVVSPELYPPTDEGTTTLDSE